jgi:hypothetical protein
MNMGRACSRYGGSNARKKVGFENLKGRGHCEDLGRDGRIIIIIVFIVGK